MCSRMVLAVWLIHPLRILATSTAAQSTKSGFSSHSTMSMTSDDRAALSRALIAYDEDSSRGS